LSIEGQNFAINEVGWQDARRPFGMTATPLFTSFLTRRVVGSSRLRILWTSSSLIFELAHHRG